MAFTFKGVATATPYFFSVTLIDQDKEKGTYRNANGYVVRERVRGGAVAVRKLSYKFRCLSLADSQTILQAIANASFTCVYPDPYTGTDRSATVYTGDRTCTLLTYESGVPVWGEIEFNCVEY
jgi:hypothetical protein